MQEPGDGEGPPTDVSKSEKEAWSASVRAQRWDSSSSVIVG